MTLVQPSPRPHLRPRRPSTARSLFRTARLAGALLAGLPTIASAHAQTLVAARAIARGEIIMPDALAVRPAPAPPGILSAPAQALGRSARRALAAGTPIRADALATVPAVRRGDIVTLRVQRGAARIEAPGIAEADADAGAPVVARNQSSGVRVRGTVAPDGSILVGP